MKIHDHRSAAAAARLLLVACGVALTGGGCAEPETPGQLTLSHGLFSHESSRVWEGCTVGCATGNATADGRPICWKNRDATPTENRLRYFPAQGGELAFIGVVNKDTDTKYIKMGLNEAGLSVGNARTNNLIKDKSKKVVNTVLSAWMLRKCKTLACVRAAIIDKTQKKIDLWPDVQAGAYPFMDASGEIRVFEVGDGEYFEYDPDHASRLAQFPRRFIVRSDGAHRNADHTDTAGVGGIRYTTARENFSSASVDGISINEMMDLVARHGDPNDQGPELQNSNRNTTGTQINHGVLQGEDPAIATMWIAIGQPDFCAFVPVWVAAGGRLPAALTDLEGAKSLTKLAWQLYNKRDSNAYDAYINTFLRPMEANFRHAVAAARARWLKVGFSVDEAAAITAEAAETVLHTMQTMNAAQTNRALNHTPTLTAINTKVQDLEVSFTRVAGDSDGTIKSTEWDFGDGKSAEGVSPTHTYQQAGTYPVRCRVRDDDGSRNSRWTYVTVSAPTSVPRPPSAHARVTPSSGVAPLEIALDASGSTDTDGKLVRYEWRQREVLSTKERFATTLRDPGTYAFTLTVWDDDGQSDQTTVWVDVVPAPADAEDGGGCAVAGSGEAGAAGLWLLLWALLIWPRRRR